MTVLDTIREYYRQKRIQRLKNLYYRIQPSVRVAQQSSYRNNQASVFSRDSIVHFFLTVFFLILINGLLNFFFLSSFKSTFSQGIGPLKILVFLPGLLGGFLSVEIADFILARSIQLFDTFFDYVLPGLGLILILSVVIAIKFFDGGSGIKRSVQNWVEDVNLKLKQKPEIVHIQPEQGVNWFFSVNDNHALNKHSLDEASSLCQAKGSEWTVYDADPHFTPQPQVKLSRPIYVWVKSASIVSGGQLNSDGIIPPKNFVQGSGVDYHSVLCIHKDGTK